jgi:hypothetical protein
MFHWNASPAGYRIDAMQGTIVPAPTAFTYSFLGSAGLIGYSRRNTIDNVIDWCRSNLTHFLGGLDAANMEDQWQYRGLPPMTRVINGTVQTSHPAAGSAHRTAGCWGTTGFLRALLRVVNIPVQLVTHAGHAQPWFMADGLYLSHGDDPYNQLTRATPPFPASEIPIDSATFDSWFGASVPAADQANNVGRRTRDLALKYLPNYILRAYCNDKAQGKTHASGSVAATFAPNYTVAQLEAEQLWQRMDMKIAGFGGCNNVPW